MDRVVSVAEMQEIEKLADAGGHSFAEMMNRAGLNLSRFVQSRYGDFENKTILGLVGSGNNGGDTLIALADMQNNGWKTCAVLFKSRPDKDPVLARAKSDGVKMLSLEEEGALQLWMPGYRKAASYWTGFLAQGSSCL